MNFLVLKFRNFLLELSRLVISQNAKQAQASDYSYTDYDALGRIIEVGQKNGAATSLNVSYLSEASYRNFLAQGTDSQITQTIYDVKPTGIGTQVLPQNHLRKRVSASIYRETPTSANINATYYNYDLTGNVKTLYQQINGLGIKKLDYEYDLISGKVNFLAYQNGHPDQFYYQYTYDAENRLLEAWSAVKANISTTGFGSTLISPHKRLDASYAYYLHGPLARVELGREQEKVQGMDYAYTLQGWLKGVNGTALNNTDMGADGSVIAKDALAFSLGYYQGDYTPIGGSGAAAFAHAYQPNGADIAGRNLYNGNIGHSTYAISGINNGATVGYTYGYDQLNRIKTVHQHSLGSNGNWDINSASNNFKETFSYDGNGNLQQLSRFNQSGAVLDNLSYHYSKNAQNRLLSNRLNQVSNQASATGSVKTTNYVYDEIGNLTQDQQEGLTVNWSVYGKIKSIQKSTGNIGYSYDAAGNRVSKALNGLDTYYVRDAQGNTLAVYDNAGNTSNWREQQLYGSSRLGLWKPNINLATSSGETQWNNLGQKYFELSNHLGNTMAVISDARTQNNGYQATVVNANDFSLSVIVLMVFKSSA